MAWDEVEAWLTKGERDLRAAHVLIRHERALDRAYCAPLKAELERLRHEQRTSP